MNELNNSNKKTKNMKPLYLGILVSVCVMLAGGIIGGTHVFGKDGTEIIKNTVMMIAGGIITVSFIKSNKDISIKELLS